MGHRVCAFGNIGMAPSTDDLLQVQSRSEMGPWCSRLRYHQWHELPISMPEALVLGRCMHIVQAFSDSMHLHGILQGAVLYDMIYVTFICTPLMTPHTPCVVMPYLPTHEAVHCAAICDAGPFIGACVSAGPGDRWMGNGQWGDCSCRAPVSLLSDLHGLMLYKLPLTALHSCALHKSICDFDG